MWQHRGHLEHCARGLYAWGMQVPALAVLLSAAPMAFSAGDLPRATRSEVMAPHALQWEKTIEVLPWQHVLVFRKR